ncbi:hypothetical protein CSC82_13920 [Rhodobacteraceae bacterium 4F10]|nr:hypothetical protein CSC82_13920 [Rhodobacteraceae bacterium 4F10]
MKNPNSARGVRAFPVTSSATLASPVDAMTGQDPATQIERRFRWCGQSNSVQSFKIRKGQITHG